VTLTYVVPTTPSRPFERGDFVDVMDRDGRRESTRKVVYAGPQVVRTDCGRRWDQRGYWIGENRAWPFPWIRHSRKKTSDTRG
jgi:hypothetical protein